MVVREEYVKKFSKTNPSILKKFFCIIERFEEEIIKLKVKGWSNTLRKTYSQDLISSFSYNFFVESIN